MPGLVGPSPKPSYDKLSSIAAEQIVGRERRERVSHDDWSGGA